MKDHRRIIATSLMCFGCKTSKQFIISPIISDLLQKAATVYTSTLLKTVAQYSRKYSKVQFVFNCGLQLERKKSAFHSNCSGSQQLPESVPDQVLPEVIELPIFQQPQKSSFLNQFSRLLNTFPKQQDLQLLLYNLF